MEEKETCGTTVGAVDLLGARFVCVLRHLEPQDNGLANTASVRTVPVQIVLSIGVPAVSFNAQRPR